MRVFVTGMGGEIGTRLARVLERRDTVESVVGIDKEPPRRRLERAEFHWLQPEDRQGVIDVIEAARPTVVVHLGIYEPHGRSTPEQARERTLEGTTALLEAIDHVGTIDHIVTRSGIEVYGRGRHAPDVPDESSPTEPTSVFGLTQLAVEEELVAWTDSAHTALARLRFAPISGAHMPSPLARYLRMTLVPVRWPDTAHFTLVHVSDVVEALVAAVERRVDRVVNVVGHGTLTPGEAVRLGARTAVPVLGPVLRVSGMVTELLGNPLPDHTRELLQRGRLADGSAAASVLGYEPDLSTADVVGDIYQWAAEDYLRDAAS